MITSWGVEVVTEIRMVQPDGTGDVAIPSRLAYRPVCDPFAVFLTFQPNWQEPVEWIFARVLLAAGMDGPAGIGDVRIWPGRHGSLAVALSSSDGNALCMLRRPLVATFLRQSYAVVARGSEHLQLDLDDELAALLEDN